MIVGSATTNRLVIRPFEERDRPAVKALWAAAFAEFPDDPDKDIDFCRGSGHGALFVGLVEADLVATVMAGHDGHRGWLYHVATRAEQRRRGYARQMVAHAEAYLAARGVPKVNLLIRASNSPVQGFYEKIGYAVEPRISMGKRFSVVVPLTAATAANSRPGMLEVVVTYMEMRARPRLPAPPPPNRKLAVLRADAITVPFYRYLYNTVGAAWLWHERRRLRDHDLAAIVRDPGVDIYVLYAGGEPAGYAELDGRRTPEIELAYFGLMPDFIGRGLGPWFLHWIIDAAWARDPRRLWVHTCNLDHPRAFTSYQRAGFVPYKQETKLIRDPRPLD